MQLLPTISGICDVGVLSTTVLPYTFCVSHYIHTADDNFFETKVSCGLQKQGMRLTAKHAMM
jgi:hypothetical protein